MNRAPVLGPRRAPLSREYVTGRAARSALGGDVAEPALVHGTHRPGRAYDRNGPTRGLGGLRRFMYNICLCICMSSRNIAVQKAVYDALDREKRAGESFTSVLRRLLDQREGLGELAGAWGRSGDRTSRARLKSLRAVGGRRAR